MPRNVDWLSHTIVLFSKYQVHKNAGGTNKTNCDVLYVLLFHSIIIINGNICHLYIGLQIRTSLRIKHHK
jgi:hypothetical protein